MSKMPQSNKVTFKSKLKWFFDSFIWLAVLLFLIDLFSKIYAYNNLELNKVYEVPFVKYFILFMRVPGNTGAAWGLLSDSIVGQILLCLISYVTSIFIIIYLIKNWKKLNKFIKATLMIILAGDVGNLIDRTFALLPFETIYSGGVIDFIDISPIIPFFGAIFNFADACLVVALFMLAIYEIIQIIKESKEEKNEEKL